MTSGAGSESSKRYSAVKTRIFVLDLVTTAAALVAFQLFIVREATLFAEGIWPGFYGTRLVLAGIFFVYLYIVALPIRITRSFVIEKVYGLSDRTFSSWAKDELKSLALSFLMLFASVTAFYCTMRYTGKYWWLVSAAAWMIFSVVMTRLFPAFIIPLFYKYSPLKDETLKGKIQSLSDRTGIFVEDICLIDMSKKTNKANAALVGLGRTRKVIISDTLADNFTHEEIEAVVAHEFGHFKYKHIWKLLLMSGAATFAAFYAVSLGVGRIILLIGAWGPEDTVLFPCFFMMIFVLSLVLMPFQNLFSRILERQADRFALRSIRDKRDFISLMRKLAEKNMADTDPSALKKIFLYDHPPISERIRMGEEFVPRG